MRDLLRRLQQVRRGPAGTYVTFFILLVGAAVLVAGVMANTAGCYNNPGTGCGNTEPAPINSSAGWNQTSGPGFTIRAIFDGTNDEAQPGEHATHILGSDGMLAGTTGTYLWTPPEYASGLLFSRPPEPGGPPYLWENLAPNSSIQVSFYFPPKPAGVTGTYYVSEYFEVQTSDGQYDRAMHTTALDGSAARSAARAAPVPVPRPAAGSAGTVWELARWFDFPDMVMDTAACQTWFDFLRGGQGFLAVRVPVTTTASGQAVRVPFVSGAGYASRLRIQRYVPASYVYTATLELRPERLSYLANNLPAASDEQWLAFGVSAGSPSCPSGLNVAAGNWSLMGTIFLDLSHQPNNCLGCIQPIYFCYEGQEAPLTGPTPALEGTTAAADGITCFGPEDMPIGTGPNWNVMGSASLTVMPPASLEFRHAVSNRTGITRDFDLSSVSDLGVTWRMYGGTGTAPDLGQVLTNTVRLTDKQVMYVWLISDPLPVDTPPGAYSVRFIAALASAPAETRWASDIIWSGEWVPPPTALPPPTQEFIYLPLLAR